MGKPHKVGEKGRHVLNVYQLPTVFHREFSYLLREIGHVAEQGSEMGKARGRCAVVVITRQQNVSSECLEDGTRVSINEVTFKDDSNFAAPLACRRNH
jgi:hypothetical protein